MAKYTVVYTGRNHPVNVDAVASGLRVLRDGDYFQFFLPMVSKPSLLGMPGEVDDRWWQALAQAGVEAVMAKVAAGLKPNSDPIEGIHLPIPLADVQQLLDDRNSLPQLREGLFGGHPIAVFDAP